MPAWPKQRDELLASGAHLLLLCRPLRYVSDSGGRLGGVVVGRTQLGPPDAGSRRRPVAMDDSEFVLDVDLAVEAIGERLAGHLPAVLRGVELTDDGLVAADPETLATSRPGAWAAGDLVNGGATVVRAVDEGRRAARHADAHLAARPGR